MEGNTKTHGKNGGHNLELLDEVNEPLTNNEDTTKSTHRHIELERNGDFTTPYSVADDDPKGESYDGAEDEEGAKVEVQVSESPFIYGIEDVPPIHISFFCGLQQALLPLSSQLMVSLLVSETVCASHDNAIKTQLLSSTLFMTGVTTLAMNLFGIRLPLYQGASLVYVVPLIMIGVSEKEYCSDSSTSSVSLNASQMNDNQTTIESIITKEHIMDNIRNLQGSLMVAGVVHTLIGFTGMVGVVMKYVGPLTIVPALVLMFVFIVQPILKFVQASWLIAMSTMATAVVLSLYLSRYNTPVPVWSPSRGFRIKRFPFHQVFSILLSMMMNWALCAVLTHYGVFTDDPNNIGYNARTDARADIVNSFPWFTMPYPGQFGPMGFSGAALVAFMIGTMISVLDSIGDYYACARVVRVPAPPPHGVNRGILIEGLCSFLSGMVGCGHATSTYGSNIGVVGITRVGSRHVFYVTGVIYILFGIFGKVSAVFVTIPHPVLGGAMIVLLGIFFGVVLSNLEVIKLSSTRNISILGLSVFVGLMIPTWIKTVDKPFSSGNEKFDGIAKMLLGNPNLCGTLLAFFLDNTVPGNKDERGITAWHGGGNPDDFVPDNKLCDHGYDVYNPLLPEKLMSLSIVKYIPFLPYKKPKADTLGQ